MHVPQSHVQQLHAAAVAALAIAAAAAADAVAEAPVVHDGCGSAVGVHWLHYLLGKRWHDCLTSLPAVMTQLPVAGCGLLV